ncbi:MAG: serine/threonine protein kinase, partial [Okeania sp. SIO2C2]|uniref:serine/threonine protein kinase n=1 Tax=Okeania sp. SIO2C2 TaxID=2607787 RepID=UPI0013BB93C2
ELFEREAKVIANLHHPQIPKYLNYFYIDTQRDRCFYLIRELVWGNSLANWVKKGWHPTEIQVKNMAIQILKILSYLHQLNPPIIHRDIKPENIILQPDGQVFLVDFGAVKDIYRQTISFSGTFVGTIGYMPPEQLQGKAYCASDLYSLGATLLYLLTHRSPDELPQKRMKIDISSCVKISPEFMNWLEVILEPMWEDRFQSATAALNVLCNKSEMIYSASSSVQYSHQKPEGSEVTLKKTSTSLIIDIPSPLGEKAELVLFIFMPFLLFFSYLYCSASSPTDHIILWLLFSLIVTPLFLYILFECFHKTHIKIHQNKFLINWSYWIFSHTITAKTEDIMRVYIDQDFQSSREVITFLCKVGKKTSTFLGECKFGHSMNRIEKEWVIAEIRDFIKQLKPHKKV